MRLRPVTPERVLEEIGRVEETFIQFAFIFVIAFGLAIVMDSRVAYFVSGVFFIRSLGIGIKVLQGLAIRKAIKRDKVEVFEDTED